jgi:hypothetical protein
LATETQILQDQIITGPLFNEPMRVVIVRPNGPDSIEAGLEGLETSNFRRVTLTSSDIASLKITEPRPTMESWNMVGVRLLTKLRAEEDLNIGVNVSISVDSDRLQNVEEEIRQALTDLKLNEQVSMSTDL